MSVTSTDVLVAGGSPDVNVLSVRTRDINLSQTHHPPASQTTLDVQGLEALLQELGAAIPIPSYPSADVLNKPLDIARVYLADILHGLLDCDTTLAYSSIQLPGSPDDGDLSIIIPKLGQGAASDLSFKIRQKFPKCSIFDLPFADGVHLRVGLRLKVLPRLLLPYILDRKGSYGQYASLGLRNPSVPKAERKKVLVEFSSPKVSNDFPVKYLRSTVLGAFIANLYEQMGWDVIKVNYLGDWGKPVGLLGVGWERYGSEELFKADPVGHLLDVNRQIKEAFAPEEAAVKKARDDEKHKKKRRDSNEPADIEATGLFAERNAFCRRMEDGDEKALAFGQRVRDVNVEYYRKQYARLNVSFDEYSGESLVRPESMTRVEEILKSKGLCEEKGGSCVIDLQKHGKGTGMAIIRDRTGSTTYLLRGLAAVIDLEQKYSFDTMIYVVAADHAVHFSRLTKLLELMDKSELAKKLQHASFSDASQVSEKEGPADALDEIIDQFEAAMTTSLQTNGSKTADLEKADNLSSVMGVKALLAQELSIRRATHHAFDVSRMASFERGTAPTLQWWCSKLSSVIKGDISLDLDLNLEDKLDEVNLIRTLAQYPETTIAAYNHLEPAGLFAYLVNVVEKLSPCLEAVEGEQVTEGQNALFAATKLVLQNGMKMLGIS